MEYADNPTRSYLPRLKKRDCDFTSNTLKSALEEQFLALSVPEGTVTIEAEAIEPTTTDKDPLFEPNAYLADEVKVEVSIRSKLEPYSKIAIQSLLNALYPNPGYEEKPFEVQAVEARKTNTRFIHRE
jgi:hypothetical protein